MGVCEPLTSFSYILYDQTLYFIHYDNKINLKCFSYFNHRGLTKKTHDILGLIIVAYNYKHIIVADDRISV